MKYVLMVLVVLCGAAWCGENAEKSPKKIDITKITKQYRKAMKDWGSKGANAHKEIIAKLPGEKEIVGGIAVISGRCATAKKDGSSATIYFPRVEIDDYSTLSVEIEVVGAKNTDIGKTLHASGTITGFACDWAEWGAALTFTMQQKE